MKQLKKRDISFFRMYKLLGIFILILIVLIMNTTCYANNENKNEITKDFKLSGYIRIMNKVEYEVNVDKNENDKRLTINASDYNLPSNLYDYGDEIRLRITYSQDDYKVLNCKVINYINGEVIEDLSEENINRLFNVEYGKSVTEKKWVDVIKLSELKQNEIYKYTANSTIQFPNFENDTGKNCIVYIKQKDNNTYEKKINMYKKVPSSSVSISFNEYNSGESFNVMYKEIGNEELIKLVEEDEIIYLSNYKNGDKLKYNLVYYIYNDTEKDITINTKDISFEVETSNTTIIEKGKIYGFDWMIDSATISYSTDLDTLPKTGEETNVFLIVLYIIVGICSIGLITLVLMKRKRK